MGKPIKYFLVARDRNTNEFEIIKVNGHRFSSLEDIDLFTMESSNREELSSRLNKEGDYDYFIVNQQKRGQNISIKTNEVVYSNDYNLEEIANNSKNKEIVRSSEQIDKIFNGYCRNMSFDGNYYRLNVTRRTNIYDKFIRYFILSRFQAKETIQNRDGGWAKTSYPLIRNIIESYQTDRKNYTHISDENYRELLERDLREVTDPTYDENQITMFDLYPNQKQDDHSKEKFEVIKTLEDIPYLDTRDAEFLNTLPQEVRNNVKSLVGLRTYYESKSYMFEEDCYHKIRDEYHNLVRKFDDEEVLSQSLLWCRVYNENSNKVSGDVNGYSYTKRNKQ